MPTALVKPFLGNAMWAMLLGTTQTHGVDSSPALVAVAVRSNTETTSYILAVYLGSTGLQRACYAVGCALTVDLAGIIVSIGVRYWSFAWDRQASTSPGGVEAQGADHPSGLGEYPHLPVADRVAGEALPTDSGPVVLLAATVDI